jgi:signal transduction histidine kinase
MPPSKKKSAVSVPLRLHPRVFASLGSDLVTSDAVAVLELVKNGYDAGADWVAVRFIEDKEHGLRLEIEDNGSGMDRETVKDVWCLVATPFREENKETKLNDGVRRVTGSKGLGRLSAARLGKSLEMTTKKSRSECVQVDVVWDDLAKAGTLDNCTVELSEGDQSKLETSTGTILRIFALNANWNDGDDGKRKVDELREGLSRLKPPFEKSRKFTVLLRAPDSEDEAQEISGSVLLENPVYRIKGNISGKGKLDCDYTFAPGTGKGRSENFTQSWDTLKEDIARSDPRAKTFGDAPVCGPFAFEIRAWDLDPDSVTEAMERFQITKKSEVRAQIRAFKGISLYRDRVLVLPKGEGARDWLGLDLRRVSKTGTRMSTSQIVGYVEVSADANPRILDTSDRERLARNPEVEQFELLLRHIVSVLENHRDRDRAKRESEATELFKGLDAEPLLAQAQELIDEKADVSEVMPLLIRFNEDLRTSRGRIERTFSHYSRLATIGLLSQILIHEIGHNSAIIGQFVTLVKNHFERNPPRDASLEKILGLAAEALASLASVADRFRPLASRSFARGKRSSGARAIWQSCCDARGQDLQRRGVDVDVSLRGDDEVQVDPGELYAVLINLLDNSLYWLGRNDEGKRKLRLDIAPARVAKRLKFSLHDSGPGIDTEDRERIFWPGFTRRPNGFGMGLTVAGEIITGHGGQLELESPGKLGGATFTFDLPSKTN